MSETYNTFVCYYCEHETDNANDVMPIETGYGFECVFQDACFRRQKRNEILADMKEMAKRPHVHPVDKITRTGVALCGFFMGLIVAMGLSYLWFGI
ncbi:hypothetical protein PBI_INGRID_45 [Arthrobacter phage Ingrid]|nr:hypothetical protein PBI_INGRID_45 [Arthrobacter phage Ingrid]QFG11027.1 hypothetical protein PBI_LORETTA_45 [Arthrobacter phage Loretta]